MCRLRNALVAVMVLWPALASAQFTLVGQDPENCTTSVATCTFGTGVTAQAGDLILVGLNARDNQQVAGSGISDGVNGDYTCPAGLDISNASSAYRVQLCYFINSGAGTVTPAVSGSVNGRYYMNFSVWRPTGAGGSVTIGGAGAISEAQSGATAGTSHSGGSVTGEASAQLVWVGQAYSGAPTTCTAGAGYTGLNTDPTAARFCGSYDITSVAGNAFTGPITTGSSVNDAVVIATFNDATAAATCTGQMLLLGAGKCEH